MAMIQFNRISSGVDKGHVPLRAILKMALSGDEYTADNALDLAKRLVKLAMDEATKDIHFIPSALAQLHGSKVLKHSDSKQFKIRAHLDDLWKNPTPDRIDYQTVFWAIKEVAPSDEWTEKVDWLTKNTSGFSVDEVYMQRFIRLNKAPDNDFPDDNETGNDVDDTPPGGAPVTAPVSPSPISVVGAVKDFPANE